MDTSDAASDGDTSSDSSTEPFVQTAAFVKPGPSEQYFAAYSKPSVTSNAKLSDYASPLSQQQLLDSLSHYQISNSAVQHNQLIQLAEASYTKLHHQWLKELRAGFSIFFHGLGSKRHVLNNLAASLLSKHGHVVIVNGFFAPLGIAEVLEAIEKSLSLPALDSSTARTKVALDKQDERAKRICDNLKQPLYLVVHNIDAPPLRPNRTQGIIALLAAQPLVHLVASVDHVRAMLCFDSDLLSARKATSAQVNAEFRAFNAIFHAIPTFRSYTTETMHSASPALLFPPNILSLSALSRAKGSRARQDDPTRARAAFFVLKSLNSKSQNVFKLLVNAQIALNPPNTIPPSASAPTSTPSYAVAFHTLLDQSQDAFLATNSARLEQLLMELKQHEVVLASQNAPDGAESTEDEEGWLWINIGRLELESLLEKMDEGME